MIFNIHTLSLVVLQIICCACTAEFTPYVPFTSKKSCIVNIIKSSTLQRIPVVPNYSSTKFLHTYTIHSVSSLKFEISEESIVKQNQAITFKLGYLRLTNKYIECPIIFLLFTNDNLFEMLYAIQKSGFGKSEDALFFTQVSILNKRNIRIISHVLSRLPGSKFKPFNAQVLFFDFARINLHIMCYFCDSNFGQIHALRSNQLREIVLSGASLNSNGYGRKVKFYLSLGAIDHLIGLLKL